MVVDVVVVVEIEEHENQEVIVDFEKNKMDKVNHYDFGVH